MAKLMAEGEKGLPVGTTGRELDFVLSVKEQPEGVLWLDVNDMDGSPSKGDRS
jgi:hypothetical protein